MWIQSRVACFIGITAPVPWPKNIEEENIPLTDEQLLEWMAEYNPEVAALESEIDRSKTAIDLAKSDYYPDLTFGVDFIDTSKLNTAAPPPDNGKDPVIALFSINLPIWRERLDAALREAEHNNFAAMQEKTEKLNSLSARLKMALYMYRDGERKIDLYHNTLLPKAVESVKASEASFRTGESSFLDLIDAQRVMLEFALDYERALTNKAQRLAELDMLVGRQIPRSEAPAPAGEQPKEME